MLITVYRTIIVYVAVIIGVRLMGKRQIGDMQPSELVVTLLLSEIAATPIQDTNQPLLYGVCSIFTLVALEIIISLLALKSFFVRKLLSGKSVILIKDGIIDKKELKRVRMTVLDLVELLRGQDVFDISTVSFAVLETGGSLSVLLKRGEQPATANDIGISSPPAELPLPVISDGKILKESLKALEIDQKTVERKLKKKDLKISQVFLMTLGSDGNCSIVKKDG